MTRVLQSWQCAKTWYCAVLAHCHYQTTRLDLPRAEPRVPVRSARLEPSPKQLNSGMHVFIIANTHYVNFQLLKSVRNEQRNSQQENRKGKKKRLPSTSQHSPNSPLLTKQRCSLSIFPGFDWSEGQGRSRNCRCHKHDRHDRERKRPLQCYGPGEELSDTQRSGQERRGEADLPVSEHGQEEASIDDDAPDGHVRQDAASHPTAGNHHCTIPENEEEGEGEWQGNDRGVDPAGECRVTEVECDELEELEHLDHFAVNEEGSAPEHDPSKGKEIEARDS